MSSGVTGAAAWGSVILRFRLGPDTGTGEWLPAGVQPFTQCAVSDMLALTANFFAREKVPFQLHSSFVVAEGYNGDPRQPKRSHWIDQYSGILWLPLPQPCEQK